MKGEHKQPAHLEKHPFGQIPVLDDASVRLFESRAIARYLNDKAGNKLTPMTPEQRAAYEQWFEVETQDYNPPIAALVRELFFKPTFYKQPTDEAAVKTEAEKLGKVLDVIESHLKKSARSSSCRPQPSPMESIFRKLLRRRNSAPVLL